MEYQPSQMELERQKRIEDNRRRMMEIGLSQAVDDIQASQQAEAAKAAPRKRIVIERVYVAEEDLRRSGREKKTVNYNEHAFFKAAEQALEDTKPKRRYLVPRARTINEGGGRAVRCSGWSPCMGMAGFNAQERCEQAAGECAQGLANTAFVKVLSQSMVSGGFWCNAPRGMTHEVAQQLGVDYKCSLMAHLPEGQSVPEDACHTNLAGDGWTMVWLPRKGEFGFSGGWRSFSLDMKLFPGDCVVVELVPKAQHRGEQETKFTIILHVFRALEYETEGEAAARQAAAALAATIKVEDGVEVKQEVAVKPEDQPTQPLTQEEWQAPRPEGSPAAVDAAAAELSGEPQQAQQAQQGDGTQQAQQAQQGGKRKRQAQLAEGGAKRTRRSLSADGKKASPAAAAAQAAAGSGRKTAKAPKAAAKAATQAEAGGSAAAAGKKGRGGGKQKQGEGAAKAAGAGKKRQSKKATVVEEEEESYDVEKIMEVRPRNGGGKEYFIKWLGWGEGWNTWEPRDHLERPLAEYQLGPGLSLADL